MPQIGARQNRPGVRAESGSAGESEREESRRGCRVGAPLQPFAEVPERETGVERGVDVLAHGVDVRRNVDRLTGGVVGEVRLPAAPLAERMQLAEKEHPTRAKDARGFAEDWGERRDVFEDEVADDDVDCAIRKGPRGAHVRQHEIHMCAPNALTSPPEHPRREIHRDHTCRALGQPGRVLPGAASQLDYRRVGEREIGGTDDVRVEVARGIVIAVVRGGPAIVGRGDIRPLGCVAAWPVARARNRARASP